MRWNGSCQYWSLIVACLVLTSMSNAYADISGKVFRDFNSNGYFDNGVGLTEIGMAGITVKAFDSTGTQVGTTATSTADGSYTLTGLSAGVDYRVEFSWTETWLKPSVAGGTSIQFAKDGSTGIDLGVNNPLDYSQETSTISVSTPVAIVGPSNQAVASGKDYRAYAALVKFPFTATGRPSHPSYIPPTSLATHAQIGSTSGAAFHRETKRLFVAAYAKRAVGFGPSGLGAIYSIDSNGTVATHAIVPNAGIDAHDFTGDYTTINYDTASVTSVGKSSLGDLEMSADGQWLYVVNLSDRHLYAISTQTTNTVTDLGLITRPTTCPENDFRPFALGMDEANTLYVGTVCSNESATSSGPSASILKYDGSGGFSEVLNFSLLINSQSFWGNWSDMLMSGYAAQSVSTYQPLLSDLVFDGKDMILAFRNRAWEIGYIPGGSSPSVSHVLKACWSGTTWTLENNGSCGGVVGALPNYNVATQAGPGGGYFFDMRDILVTYGGQAVINALGSLAIVPGRGMIATLADPQDLISGGTIHLNPANGAQSMPYQIFRGSADGTNGGGDGGYFGKTSGLGDLELLLDVAPLEIGNRVWADEDGDGLQDAGEKGLAGIPVKLFSGTTELASAITADDGTYYFSNATGSSTASKIYGLTQLQPNLPYTIKFPSTTTIAGSPYQLTVPMAGSDSQLDSNALLSGEVVILPADIPVAGANNHSFDVGYRPLADVELTKVVDKQTSKRGETIRYTLTVTNQSAAAATGVEVLEQLPTGIRYINHQASQGNYDAGTGLWTVGSLAKGAAASLVIEAIIN